MPVQWKKFTPKLQIMPDASRLKIFQKRLRGDCFPSPNSVFRFYCRTSDEKYAGAEVLKAEVLPRLAKRDSFLDIGTAEGAMTYLLAREFKRCFAIEKDSRSRMVLERFLRLKLGGHGTEITLGQSEYPESDLLPSHFLPDLTLMSHMLYYHNRDQWSWLVKTAVRFSSPGGAVAIILHGDEGSADKGQVTQMTGHFGGRSFAVDAFAQECIDARLGKTELLAVDTHHWAAKIDGIATLAHFLMLDTGANYLFHELNAYLEENHKRPDGVYELAKTDKIIVVYKG